MFNKLKAWIEMLKLFSKINIMNEVKEYLKLNVVRVMDDDGLFDSLDSPKGLGELANELGYKDLELLKEILKAFSKDGFLNLSTFLKYETIRPLDYEISTPRLFNQGIKEVWERYAEWIPKRLRGEYADFTAETALFDWDDALAAKAYGILRSAAFKFADALNEDGRFLDVGCGNGIGTTDIFHFYQKKDMIPNVDIFGMDVNNDLLEIADQEFKLRLKTRHNLSNGQIESLEGHLPKFRMGSVDDMPFEDDFFDIVYISQVLHWSDAERAVAEMLRVLKPGGMIFGSQTFFPVANKYLDFHARTMEGASGFFTQEKFKNWAYDNGAKKVSITTPLSVFKIEA